MGKRSAGETLAQILAAFLRRRVWSQSELAKHCGVSVKAIRQRLRDLSAAGVPLESEVDTPHVFWNVPRGWYPSGTLLEPCDVALSARLLSRLPVSTDQLRALSILLGTQGGQPRAADEPEFAKILGAVEDGARERRTVRIDYYTSSRGEHALRDVSIHRILYGDRVRVVASCHRTSTLKFFRVDEIRSAKLSSTPFHEVDAGEVEAFLQASIDGYHAPAEAVACVFFVAHPDARWVARNLPQGPISAEHLADGICFSVNTAGIDPLARFVVGLGAAARAETPELRQRVQQLALGALSHCKPLRKVNARSVLLNRATE